MTRTAIFAREQLRAPVHARLAVAVPALFVISAAGVLSDFASVLGGSLGGDAAVALSAGWAAALISGTLGFSKRRPRAAPIAAWRWPGWGRRASPPHASPRRSASRSSPRPRHSWRSS